MTLPIALLLTIGAGGEVDLATRYVPGTEVRVTRATTLELETTDFSMERGGEPFEPPDFGGPRGSRTETTVVLLDRVLEASEGRPTVVERTFESAEGEAARFDTEVALDAPLDGRTLRLTAGEDGEVEAEPADGGRALDAERLAGHRLTLALDALLSGEPVEPGDAWDVEPADLLAALGMDVADKLFATPEPELGGARGRGRDGPRGGRGGRFFEEADWDASATLSGETEEVDGLTCHVVELRAEGDGTLAPRERGGFGRGRRWGPAPAAPVETEFTIELEGRLLFSTELARPVSFTVEGGLEVEADDAFERGDTTMRIRRRQEGLFEQTVRVEEVEE